MAAKRPIKTVLLRVWIIASWVVVGGVVAVHLIVVVAVGLSVGDFKCALPAQVVVCLSGAGTDVEVVEMPAKLAGPSIVVGLVGARLYEDWRSDLTESFVCL